jgi:hypothetical protein
MSGGEHPYSQIEGRHLSKFLLSGGRLEMPIGCPDLMYGIVCILCFIKFQFYYIFKLQRHNDGLLAFG